MSERLLPKPLSPNAYKKETDGPNYMLGFVGLFLDDGATVVFEHSSMGAKKAVNALATAATQALVAFGEIVHPVIELGIQLVRELLAGRSTTRSSTWSAMSPTSGHGRPTSSPMTTSSPGRSASRAKLRREAKEAPAL